MDEKKKFSQENLLGKVLEFQDQDLELRGIQLTIMKADLFLEENQLKRKFLLSQNEESKIIEKSEALNSFVKVYLGHHPEDFNDNVFRSIRKVESQDILHLKDQESGKQDLESKKIQVRLENSLKNHFRQTGISEGHLSPSWKENFEFQRSTESFIHFCVVQKQKSGFSGLSQTEQIQRTLEQNQLQRKYENTNFEKGEKLLGESIFRLDRFIVNQEKGELKQKLKLKNKSGEEVGFLFVNILFSYEPKKKITPQMHLYKLQLNNFFIYDLEINLESLQKKQCFLSVHFKQGSFQKRLYTETRLINQQNQFQFVQENSPLTFLFQSPSSTNIFIDLCVFNNTPENQAIPFSEYQFFPQTVIGVCQLDLEKNFQLAEETDLKFNKLSRPSVINRYGTYVGKMNFEYNFQKPAFLANTKKNHQLEMNTKAIFAQNSLDIKFQSPEYKKKLILINKKTQIKERFRSSTDNSFINLPKIQPPIVSNEPQTKKFQNLGGGNTERFKEFIKPTNQLGSIHQSELLPEHLNKLDQELQKRRKEIYTNYSQKKKNIYSDSPNQLQHNN